MNQKSDIEIFQSPDGQTQIEVTFDQETVWLSLEQLAVLFNRDRTVIGRHVRNIFQEAELAEEVVCANFAHTTEHGALKGKSQTNTTKYFNLDVIISVGYRVKSSRGVQFRQWASKRLKDYLVAGYLLNVKRLDQTNREIHIIKFAPKFIYPTKKRQPTINPPSIIAI